MTPFSKCLSLTVGFHILFTGYREVMPLYTPCSLVIYSPVNFSLVFILSRLQFYKLLFLNFYLRDYTLFITPYCRSVVFYFDSECANCQKRAWGSIEFCCLRPEGPIARVGLLGKGSGQSPGRSRFFCTLRSPSTPCSLFCYVIKGKQLQKSFSLAAKGVEPTPLGPEITPADGGGVFNCYQTPISFRQLASC